MIPETYSRIRNTARRVVKMLVEHDYSGLERLSNGIRLSAESLDIAVKSYGRTLCDLPSEDWDKLDIVEVLGSRPLRFSVRVDLWTEEEDRSDLSLELTLVDTGETFEVEIDDLHVL